MAEILGAVASGIAVTSMAIQLSDNIHKLQSYLETIKDAPSDIRSIILDLESLRLVLGETEHTLGKGTSAKYSAANLDLLHRSLKTIHEIVTELSAIQPIGRIHFAIKKSRIQSIQHSLKSCLASLNLVLTLQNYESTRLIEESITKHNVQNLSVVQNVVRNNGQAVLHGVAQKCEYLQKILNERSESSNPFRSVKLEIQRLRQGLNDLEMLMRSKSLDQIPTSDYIPALNITNEALSPVLNIFVARRIPRDERKALMWWSKPEIQREARNCLRRLEQARAALIAAQLAATSRYDSRENSAIVAISKNLDYLPSRISLAIRSTFKNQVDAAIIDIEEKRATSRSISTYAFAWICNFSICKYTYSLGHQNRFDRRYVERTCFTILPAKWLQPLWRFRIWVGKEDSYYSLRLQRILPSDAQIFEACQNFNIKDMRHEFELGFASPFDVDCTGRGLIDIALDEIIRISNTEDYFEEAALVGLRSRFESIEFLFSNMGSNFDDTTRLFVEVASETTPVRSKLWDERMGVVPGWLLLSLIGLDLEMVWEIQETWVSATELRHDWWYYAYLERPSQALESKAKSLSTELGSRADKPVQEIVSGYIETSNILQDQYFDAVESFDDGAFPAHGNSPPLFRPNIRQGQNFDAIDSLDSVKCQSLGNTAFSCKTAPAIDTEEGALRRQSTLYSESTGSSDDGSTIGDSTNILSIKDNINNGSTIATSVSNSDRPTIATDEFVELLEEQSQLKQYFNIAPTVTDVLHFQERFYLLLWDYGVTLIGEASNSREEAAGQLVVLQSRFIATVLGLRFFPKDISKQLGMDSLDGQNIMTMDEKLIRLWKSLEANELDTMDAPPEDLEIDFEENLDLPFLTTIRDLQGFLFSGGAFAELQSQLRAFVCHDKKVNNGSDYSVWLLPLHLLLRAQRLAGLIHTSFAVMFRRIRILSRPPVPPGHRRLEWRCECGDELYADFDNSSPDAIKSLKRHLDSLWPPRDGRDVKAQPQLHDASTSPLTRSESNKDYAPQDIFVAAADINTPSMVSGDLTHLATTGTLTNLGTSQHVNSTPPPQVTVHTNTGDSMSSDNTSRSTSSSQPDGFNAIDPSDPSRVPIPPATFANINASDRNPVYVEICVKHKEYTSRHKEVQVDMAEDDYHFFQRVKDAYLEIRLPRWNTFLKPYQIKHVQFSVQNMGEVVGIFHHDGPRIPPEEEVKSGLYHYHPCPWTCEPVPSNIVLYELNSEKSQLHTSRTWSRRIPKKCAASIFSIPNPDDAAIGYGIHIIEGYDNLIVAILMFFGVFVAALATAVWWGKGNPGDIQGATGLGSLILGTVAALIISYQALLSR